MFTVSDDGLFKMTYLIPNVPNCTIFPELYYPNKQNVELTCFSLRHLPFIHRSTNFLEVFIGSQLGQLIYYKKDLIWTHESKTADQSVKEIIYDDRSEGAITNILSYKDVVVYSTKTKVRVIHYEKRQKICMIERPEFYPTFPEYLD